MSAGSTAAHGPATGGYKDRLRRLAHGVLDPVVAGLARIGVRPNHMTTLGFGLSGCAGLAFAVGRFRLAALITCATGVCDILDGQLARRTGGETRFGAFLDSTLDRLSEAALLLGIAGYYAIQLVLMTTDPERVLRNLQHGLEPITYGVIALLAMLAMAGSFMVSYTRARAEGLGLGCKVGWFERPERIVLIILMGFLGLGPAIPAGLLILVTFSFATAFQRLVHVWKLTRDAGSGSGSTEA